MNMSPEERFERIEETLDRMVADSEARFTRLEANLESLQDFMSAAFKRSETRLDRIESALLKLAEMLDQHMADGHGGKVED
jgi:hypothetical protein